jgi:hypothetical protein
LLEDGGVFLSLPVGGRGNFGKTREIRLLRFRRATNMTRLSGFFYRSEAQC